MKEHERVFLARLPNTNEYKHVFLRYCRTRTWIFRKISNLNEHVFRWNYWTPQTPNNTNTRVFSSLVATNMKHLSTPTNCCTKNNLIIKSKSLSLLERHSVRETTRLLKTRYSMDFQPSTIREGGRNILMNRIYDSTLVLLYISQIKRTYKS